MITTASWLSISVYLWCITHFNAILIQRLSCHCSVFGWGKKKKQTHNSKQQMAVTYSMLSPGNKGQANAQHLPGSSNSELLIARLPLPISIYFMATHLSRGGSGAGGAGGWRVMWDRAAPKVTFEARPASEEFLHHPPSL